MNRPPDRIVGLLLLLATIALGISTRTWYFPLGLGLVIVTHLILGWRFEGGMNLVKFSLVALPFGLWYRFLPREGFIGYGLLDMLLLVGFFLTTVGVFHLIAAKGSRYMAVSGAVLGLALAGAAPKTMLRIEGMNPVPVFVPLTVVFVPLLLVAMRRATGLWSLGHLGRYWAVYGASLVVVLSLGALTEVVVVRRVPAAARWLNQQIAGRLPASSFNPRRAHLGAIPSQFNSRDRQAIALRFFGMETPTYLRGQAFQVYDAPNSTSWMAIEDDADTITANEEFEGRSVFNMAAGETLERLGTVYPEAAYADGVFLPTGVHRVDMYADRVRANRQAFLMRPTRLETLGGYSVYKPASRAAGPEEADLAVPAHLKGALSGHAQAMMGDAKEAVLASGRLQVHFQTHFKYQLGLVMKGQKDPVLEFLEDLKAGHCELFASAAVLMLRTRGIPARYVTGFSVTEKLPGQDCWVARKQDAHAWVEMFVPGRGWVTYDPTPPTARPVRSPLEGGEAWLASLVAAFKRVLAVVVHGGPKAVLANLWLFVTWMLSLVPLWVWVLIILGGVVWIFRGRLLRRQRPRALALSVRARELRARLKAAEKLVSRYGVHRGAAQTASEFEASVRASAEIPAEVKAEAAELIAGYRRERFAPEG